MWITKFLCEGKEILGIIHGACKVSIFLHESILQKAIYSKLWVLSIMPEVLEISVEK